MTAPEDVSLITLPDAVRFSEGKPPGPTSAGTPRGQMSMSLGFVLGRRAIRVQELQGNLLLIVLMFASQHEPQGPEPMFWEECPQAWVM